MIRYVFVSLSLLFVLKAYNQSCLPDGITFTNQDQLDSFTILYPDCKEILGDVIIENTSIERLDALIKIKKIYGDLRISKNNALKNLKGFDNLQIIGGSLFLNNLYLLDINDLSNLDSIGHSLSILEPGKLNDLVGLSGLTKINNDIIINTTSLKSYEGLHNIAEIGGKLSLISIGIDDYAGFRNLKKINGRGLGIHATDRKNLKGFENLESINNLEIASQNLESLDGLDKLKEVKDNLYIDNVPLLNDISVLSNIKSIGHVRITSCPKLHNLHGLENIEFVKDNGIVILDVPNLTSLHELSNLKHSKKGFKIHGTNIESLYGLHNLSKLDSIEWDGFIRKVSFAGNKNLTDCGFENFCEYISDNGFSFFSQNATGCNSKEEILAACATTICPEGDVYLYTQSAIDSFAIRYPDCHNIYGSVYISDASIDDLQGLQQLHRIYGNLSITESPSLMSISGFDSLKLLTGNLEIAGNQSLAAVATFGQIHTLDGDLIIQDNPMLAGVEGLTQLKNIWGNIDISNNANMSNLNWLESLKRVDKNIYITNNEQLQSLSGLNNISTYHLDTIVVGDNAKLSYCAIESICQRLKETIVDTFYQNATGCNDRHEVIDACTSSTNDATESADLIVYPNPSGGKVYFGGRSCQLQIIKVGVFDAMGRFMKSESPRENIIDITNLAEGVYFLRFHLKDGGILPVRVVKV